MDSQVSPKAKTSDLFFGRLYLKRYLFKVVFKIIEKIPQNIVLKKRTHSNIIFFE